MNSQAQSNLEYFQNLEKEINRLSEEVEEMQQQLNYLTENMILICERLIKDREKEEESGKTPC